MGFIRCLLYAAAIGIGSFLLGRLLPAGWFLPEKFPYRSMAWEKGGRIYDSIFHIRKWQAKVPDMSKLLPGLMQPKKVTKDFRQELPRMIQETCIAELIHSLLCLAALPCLRIWPGWGGIIFTVLYMLGNIPFIMIQRYNRPRLLGLLERMSPKDSGKEL